MIVCGPGSPVLLGDSDDQTKVRQKLSSLVSGHMRILVEAEATSSPARHINTSRSTD